VSRIAQERRELTSDNLRCHLQILVAGKILVSRHCATEPEARYVAEAARKNALRTGSTAVESDGASGAGGIVRRSYFTNRNDTG
jgi:hypothetical protein